MIIPFGEYLPDLNTFGTNAVTQAVNVEPLAQGYRCMPDAVQISIGSGLASTPRGAFEALYGISSGAGTQNAVFAGTSTKLYYQTSAGSVSDVSRVAGYTVDPFYLERWDFTQFGTKVLACGGTTSTSWFPIQTYTLGAGGTFADISGAPGARTIGVVRDFVVVGHTYDATDGYRPTRIRWCGFGDETSWAVSAATQADLQDLTDASGPVRQIVSGDTGMVFCERAIYALDYAGPPVTFRIRKITTAFGLAGPGLAIEYGGFVYCLTQAGFKAISPDGGIQHIGDGKVDKTAIASGISLANSSAAVDQMRGLIFFQLNPGIAYVYSTVNNRWATYDFTLSSINTSPPLIHAYKGDYTARGVGAWDSANRLWRLGFSLPGDAPVVGKIDTAERQINPQGRATTTLVRPIVTGGTLDASSLYVLRRDSQRDSLSATTALPYNVQQDYFQGNVTAKYHGFRFQAQQTNAVYLGLDIVNAKPRGRR